MEKRNKCYKKIICFLITIALTLTANITLAFGFESSDYERFWIYKGKPTFNIANSKYVNLSDTTYDGRKTTIIDRLKGSYSYRERTSKVKDAVYMQPYFWVNGIKDPTSKIDYTDISTTTTGVPGGKVGYTSWFDSPFATFLDYQTRYIAKPSASVLDWKSATNSTLTKPTDPVQDSIDYAKILFGSNKRAYIASTWQGGELADAKIASVSAKNPNMYFPVLLNNGKTIDTKVMSAIKDMGVKDLYIMGGFGIFNSTAGLTSGYNIVRVGGIDRNETMKFYNTLPNEIDNLKYLPKPNSDGIIISGSESSKIKASHITAIRGWLESEKNKKDGTYLNTAADFLMKYYKFGSQPQKNSLPVLTIGVNMGSYEAYWICYYNDTVGTYVYQLILGDYFEDLKSNISVEYRDVDTDKILKTTSAETVQHQGSNVIEKTYSAPIISGYDYHSSKMTLDGTTSTGANPAKISVKPGTANKVVFYYKQRKNVNVTVEYRDIDTDKSLRTPLRETVSIILDKPVEKTYSAPVISGFEYNSSKVTSGGATSTGTNPVKISVKPKGVNKVIFYYKKSPIKDVGVIKFNPNETEWTNKGKISEGVGKYEVEVFYEGNNPIEDIGRWEKVNEAGEVLAGTFPVKFELDNISVTGAAKAIVDGTRGNVNIEQEGEKIRLSGIGKWKEPIFQSPETPYELPNAPKEPVGESGYYNIDWTKTNIEVKEPDKKWVNSPLPYKIDIKVSDNLSGFAEGSKVIVNDSSHYKNNTEEDINARDLLHNRAVVVPDGIYRIQVKANDIAGNENSMNFEKYLVDGTTPTMEFSVKSKLFSEENGAIRKESKKGSGLSYYGTLKAKDNLSGVGKIQYRWSYSGDKPKEKYEVLYESEYTENDRYEEEISKEIEKPVGDNVYLHVEMWDVAGNYNYQCFGPFEDPIMLKDFQVTDIRDPRWTSIFWKDDKFEEYTEKKFKVNELPIDEKSHTTLKNILPKKGYAFYFDITSEYLYRDNDRIEIKPSFYYIKDDERIRVDCYYNNSNNPLVGFGSKLDDSTINLSTKRYGDVLIGNYNKLILTRGVRIAKGREWKDYDGIKGWKDEIQYIDGKEQWWYGKYFIPSSSFFVKAGDNPRPENHLKGGNILINFEIVAYKKGIETLSTDQLFSYKLSQWKLEGGPKNSNYKVGDVIIYNGKYGVISDYSGRVIQ